jgi:hypothetical protein
MRQLGVVDQRSIMAREDFIESVLDPSHETASVILDKIGLASLPSREQIHHEIEQELLLLREKLPDHWLPTYQMYERHLSSSSKSSFMFLLKTLATSNFCAVPVDARTITSTD